MTLFWLALSKSVPINSLKVLTTAKGASNMLVNLLCKRRVWLGTERYRCLMKYTLISTLQICLIGTLMAYFKSKTPGEDYWWVSHVFKLVGHQSNLLSRKYWPATIFVIYFEQFLGPIHLEQNNFCVKEFVEILTSVWSTRTPYCTAPHNHTDAGSVSAQARCKAGEASRSLPSPPTSSSHRGRVISPTTKTILAWFSTAGEG